MMLKQITAPASESITLDEAKSQCHIDGTSEDAYLMGLIIAAREWCEEHDWRSYLTQTWELWLEAWPSSGIIKLPKPPLASVTSIKYYDTADVEATFAATDYFVDTISVPGRVVLKYNKTWPTTQLRTMNSIVVRYVAGWTSASNVPQRVRQAMLLLIGHWYENRENTTVGAVSRSIEFGVTSLLGVDRAFEF